MLALQQNIKTITDSHQDGEFERAKRYYSLFMMSPPDMLENIRHKQEFTFDEYKTMLDLQCGVDPSLDGGPKQPTGITTCMSLICTG
ncbi:hypothetical protein A0H81_00775 [Grifola frondosa]|uniref:Uncharacterized protein n=1 Tax=Grifola frondosa TaxID=5627 RepID=A0A1C7MSQ4_GRIFR|nr:hypothetical protein A0H81_00775 [Grifola frondosa]